MVRFLPAGVGKKQRAGSVPQHRNGRTPAQKARRHHGVWVRWILVERTHIERRLQPPRRAEILADVQNVVSETGSPIADRDLIGDRSGSGPYSFGIEDHQVIVGVVVRRVEAWPGADDID